MVKNEKSTSRIDKKTPSPRQVVREQEFSSQGSVQEVLNHLAEFTRSILHGVTSPYAALTGHTDLLLQAMQSMPGYVETDEIQAFMEGLKHAREGFEALVRKLRVFAEPLSLVFEPIALNDFIRSLLKEDHLAQCSVAEKRRIHFTTRLKDGQDIAEIDVMHFSMALRLFLEAVLTAPEGKGPVRCRLERGLSPESPFLWEAVAAHGAPSPKGFLRLSIRDKSGAWAGYDLTHLFLPFSAPDQPPPHKLERLDLPIAYRIVRSHGGFFRFIEESNRSTCLMLYLPE